MTLRDAGEAHTRRGKAGSLAQMSGIDATVWPCVWSHCVRSVRAFFVGEGVHPRRRDL